MDIIQKQYLEQRLKSATRDKESEFKRPLKPDRVRDAEKVVARWERMYSHNRHRFYVRIQNAARRIKEVILFGDPQKALKAVKDFEARKF